MANRPARPQAYVFYNLECIFGIYGRHRTQLESCEFLSVSVLDRGGDRRRKQRGEFHNPRNDPGAVPRVDRPCHQRLVLDRRRVAFLVGSVLGLFIILLRAWIPESPRWLVIHGRQAEAEKIVGEIEASFRLHRSSIADASLLKPMVLRPRRFTPLKEVFHTLFVAFRTRTLVCLTLMATQAFFYNAVFFTYALVLTKFYSVPSYNVGWYILPFVLGNVLGPLVLGPLFDSIGRKPMIALTYVASGVLLALSGWLFMHGLLSALEQTIAWTVIFFFASAAAGAAYLTASENFPVEIRALAIAFFYSAGTAIGGTVAPFLFAVLIESGSRESVFVGYLLGSLLMVVAAIVAAIWGVAAERKPLEEVARPLSSL
jgi:Sugar (and other) transporter